MRSQLCRAVAGAALLGAVAVASLSAQAAERDDNTGFGTTSAEFLLLGAGARGAALGNSFAAIATDPTALYWNPAGVAEMMRPGFSFSTYTYVAESRYSWGGVAFPFNDGQSSIGFQFGTFGFGEQPVYTLSSPDGDGTTYSVAESFGGVTYAQNFSDRFSAGITGMFISDQIADSRAQGFAIDFGASFHALIAEKPIRASFVIANLGSTLTHTGTGLDVNVQRPPPPGQTDVPQDPQPGRYQTVAFGLPVVFRIGLSYDFMSSASNRLTLLGNFEQPNNSNPTAGGGLEYALMDIGQSGFSVMARGSYDYKSDNNYTQDPALAAGFATSVSGESMDGLALGGGLAYGRGDFMLSLDYAYRHLGILGGTNVFSATVNW